MVRDESILTWISQVSLPPVYDVQDLFFVFLCLCQARLASGGIVFSACPFVCLSICLSVTKLVTTVFWKQLNQFWCQLAQMVHGARAWNGQLWSQEVKAQGHTRPKIDLEAGRSTILDPVWSSCFSRFVVRINMCLMYYIIVTLVLCSDIHCCGTDDSFHRRRFEMSDVRPHCSRHRLLTASLQWLHTVRYVTSGRAVRLSSTPSAVMTRRVRWIIIVIIIIILISLFKRHLFQLVPLPVRSV